MTVLARGRVLSMKGGEVGARALVACWGPGAAGVGSMAPFEARRALPRGRGHGPRLASSRDANEGDGCLQEFAGDGSLLCVNDLDLQRGLKRVGVRLVV